MGATSATGVSGSGIGIGKGPDGQQPFMGFEPPRVLAAGLVQTDGNGDAIVEFPHPLPGDNHAITVTCAIDDTSVIPGVGRTYTEGLNLITISGESNTYYHYIVVSVGVVV